MPPVLEWIVTHWSAAVATGGTIVAVAAFAKILLEIRQLRMQISKLQKELDESQRLVRVASTTETERYGKILNGLTIRQELSSGTVRGERGTERERIDAALPELKELLDRLYAEERYDRRQKLREERQKAYTPEGLELEIFRIAARLDKTDLSFPEIRQQLPKTSKVELYAALGAMEQLGVFSMHPSAYYGDKDRWWFNDFGLAHVALARSCLPSRTNKG